MQFAPISLKKFEFWKIFISVDEKWVLYVNLKRRPQWLDKNEAPQLTQKLTRYYVFGGIIKKLFIISFTNQTITSEVYSAELERLAQALREK